MNDLDNFNNFTMLKMFNLDEKKIQEFKVYDVPILNDENKVIRNVLNIDVKLIDLRPQCIHCDSKDITIKDYVPKKLKHSTLKNKECIINYKARRYKCKFCQKTYYEHNPFALSSMRYTMNTVYNVLGDLKDETETFASCAKRHNLSVNTVIKIFDDYVSIARKQLDEILCIDEVYAFKSRDSKYVCVLLDYKTQEILDLLPSRRIGKLATYFRAIPIEERRRVKIVSIDMWSSYRTITQEFLPNAVCAVDKFHVFQEFTKRFTRVRIEEMNHFSPINDKPYNELSDDEKSERYKRDINYYLLKKFNWLLFKTNEKYSNSNYPRRYNHKLKGRYNYYELKELILNGSPKLLEVYNLQHYLRLFYSLSYDEAKYKINELIDRFKKSNVPQMNDFANTLINWKNEIVNSFLVVSTDGRTISNAIIENRNKSIKTIKRNGNGYTNWDRFRNRVLYSVNESSVHRLYRIKKD